MQHLHLDKDKRILKFNVNSSNQQWINLDLKVFVSFLDYVIAYNTTKKWRDDFIALCFSKNDKF